MKSSKIKLFGKLISGLAGMKHRRTYNVAIILAAGSSTRMGKDKTKQWQTIGGLPAVARSVKAYDNSRCIDEIIVCAKEDELQLYQNFKTDFAVIKPLLVIKGGSSRQMSALEGFKHIPDKTGIVVIHDAARCLVTPEMIEKVVSAASSSGAACACCKSIDTVKLSTDSGLIENTPERTKIRLAQTPQAFSTEIYRASAYKALADGICVTDDASMAEHAGFAVKLVDCGRENIKITEPADIPIAEAILNYREQINGQ